MPNVFCHCGLILGPNTFYPEASFFFKGTKASFSREAQINYRLLLIKKKKMKKKKKDMGYINISIKVCILVTK
jgi:hypothetical protein